MVSLTLSVEPGQLAGLAGEYTLLRILFRWGFFSIFREGMKRREELAHRSSYPLLKLDFWISSFKLLYKIERRDLK